MPGRHRYTTALRWTGNLGTGTTGYRDYSRRLESSAEGRPVLAGSSDAVFHGDADRWNPELLLVAALSQCHMLSYLHCAASAGVVVVGYDDEATGLMAEDGRGGGHFVEVVLRPRVAVADAAMVDEAWAQHGRAAQLCFIAASVNFPVRHEPTVTAEA